jgi:hypothetical protein
MRDLPAGKIWSQETAESQLVLEKSAKEDVLSAYNTLKAPCFLERRWIKLDSGKILVHVTEQNLANYKDQTGEQIVAVAYTDGNETVLDMTSIKGKFVESSGTSKDFLDCVWLPEGFQKTLAVLGEHCGIQNSPYLDLADDIRKHTFTGLMEVHIFVAPLNAPQEVQDKFKKDCNDNGLKCCNLRLDTVHLGMVGALMSSRYVSGTMDKIWRESFKDAQLLAKLGWDVIRNKIEATASIEGVPVTDTDAKSLPKKTYFEFHMVFQNSDGTTPDPKGIEEVKGIAKKLEQEWNICIPLSENCFGTQRFLNMRTYGIGRENAFPRLEELAEHVRAAGYLVPRFIREFGVYDSAVEVDCGWLEPLKVPGEYSPGFLPPIVYSN